MFTVHEPDQTTTTLRLPRNAFAQIHVGLELGPPESAFFVGASLVQFWLAEDSVVDRPSDDADRDETVLRPRRRRAVRDPVMRRARG